MTDQVDTANAGASRYDEGRMKVLRAQVRDGRLVLNEPTDLPEGSEVELMLVEDELDPEERARLLQAIEEGAAEIERGDWVDGDEFLAELRARLAAPNR